MTANGQLAYLFSTCVRENNSPNQQVSVVCIHNCIYLQIFANSNVQLRWRCKIRSLLWCFRLSVLFACFHYFHFFLFTGSLSWSATYYATALTMIQHAKLAKNPQWWSDQCRQCRKHHKNSADRCSMTFKIYCFSFKEKINDSSWLILHSRACTHFCPIKFCLYWECLIIIPPDIF